MNDNKWLIDFSNNTYSGDGEDGSIEKVLSLIPGKNNWCVEFGAWDGLFLTNTRNLIENHCYKAVLIEGNESRYSDLRKNYYENDKVVTINELVGFSEDHNLDHILSKTLIPIDYDLLSIDIDGNDYHVWAAVEKDNPKIVLIEYNPTIPSHVEFVQKPDPNVKHGASIMSLYNLGKKKGYELICITEINAIFVRKEFYSLFGISCNEPHCLRLNDDKVTHFFIGYDGTIFLRGPKHLFWHGVGFDEKDVQVLPSLFRDFPENFSFFRKLLWGIYRWPRKLRRSIKKRLKYINS